MAIYDTIILGATATGMQLLPAGKLGLYQVSVPAGDGIVLSMMQIAMTEDFSIRAWFSLVPAGISIISGTFQVFPLIRAPTSYILYDPAITVQPPAGVLAFPVAPGDYVLNFLNLANMENIFSFKVDTYNGYAF
jgi:hypothetical protein